MDDGTLCVKAELGSGSGLHIDVTVDRGDGSPLLLGHFRADRQHADIAGDAVHEVLHALGFGSRLTSTPDLQKDDAGSLEVPRSHRYKSWSSEEDAQLADSFVAGSAIGDLAIEHGRTQGAIRARFERIGMIDKRSRAGK